MHNRLMHVVQHRPFGLGCVIFKVSPAPDPQRNHCDIGWDLYTDADVVVGHLSSKALRKDDASALSSRKDNGLTYGEYLYTVRPGKLAVWSVLLDDVHQRAKSASALLCKQTANSENMIADDMFVKSKFFWNSEYC